MQKLEGKILDRKHREALKNDSPLGNAPKEEITFAEKLQYARELRQDYD